MSSPHSTQPDSDWTSRALVRVAEDWAMMIDHEVSIENVQVERESSAPACEGSVHIAFQFGLTHAELGPRYRGALLVPLPDALTMAAYLMMTPENQIAGARAAQAPDSATKDSLMELSSILASALDGVVQDSFEGTWSVTSLGCQGVREGAVPRVSTADDLEWTVARAQGTLADFDAFPMQLVLPVLASPVAEEAEEPAPALPGRTEASAAEASEESSVTAPVAAEETTADSASDEAPGEGSDSGSSV